MSNSILTDNIKTIEFDALIVGGGGSGMRASLELAKSGLKTAVVSKVFPNKISYCFCTRWNYMRHCKR